MLPRVHGLGPTPLRYRAGGVAGIRLDCLAMPGCNPAGDAAIFGKEYIMSSTLTWRPRDIETKTLPDDLKYAVQTAYATPIHNHPLDENDIPFFKGMWRRAIETHRLS